MPTTPPPKLIAGAWRRSKPLCRSPKIPGVIVPCRLHALVLVEQLRTASQRSTSSIGTSPSSPGRCPTTALFEGLPGAGPHLAPRLLAAFGEHRERFQGADELQKYSGIAPVTERSGKKSWVHWRWQCPTFLRQTFVEWAGQTINKSFWAGAYYRPATREGQYLPSRRASVGVQVDPHPLPLLADPDPLRRDQIPQRPEKTRLFATEQPGSGPTKRLTDCLRA